ncbi:MAG: cobalamin-binding protein [Longimicrobiaceae bacterium]
MRIVSLLSSATEIVHELGLDDELVAISHECDHPPQLLDRPRVSRSRFDPAGLTSGEIDAEVRRQMELHGGVYQVDAGRLERLRPDLMLTQGVCEVCAVPVASVEAVVEEMEHPPRVLSLDAHTLEGILATIRQVAVAAGRPELGEGAVSRLRGRLAEVTERVAGRARPRVLVLEWLDPPFAPGHWLPEMVQLAGGDNLLGAAGKRSVEVSWERIADLDPDVLLLAPCGYDLEQTRSDAGRHRERLEGTARRAVSEGRAWLLHSGYFSRSGPRVVRGVEALAALLHPGSFPAGSLGGVAEPWA